MAVTRYPLNNNNSPSVTGTREFSAALVGGYNSSAPAPPTQSQAAVIGANCYFQDSGVAPHASPGAWYEFFFEKQAGASVALETIFMVDWGYFVGCLSVTASGGVGTAAASNSNNYAALNAGKSADGVVPTGWHRVRLIHPNAAGSGHVAQFFIGSNKFGSTPDFSVGTWDTYSAPVSNNPDGLTGIWSIGMAEVAISGLGTRFSDIYYGLIGDAYPTFSSDGTVTSVITASAVVTASFTGAGDQSGTVSSVITASASVAGTSSPPPSGAYYPTQTRIHARADAATDAPSDPIKGGPAVMGSLAGEVEAISSDLVNARNEGAGFSTIRAALAAMWAALTGKADTGHGHVASSISDFNTAVRANRLDQMAAPTAPVAFGSQRITGLGAPTAASDAATKAYADGLVGSGGADSNLLQELRYFLSNGYTASPQIMTAPPTLTVSAAGAATAISGSVLTAPNSSIFRYTGAAYSNIGSVGSFSNCYRQNHATESTNGSKHNRLRVEFETDSNDFEAIFRTEDTNPRYKVWVDGQPASSDLAISSVSNEIRRIRVQFGSAKVRHIIIEAAGVTFCGVAVGPTRSIWRSLRDTGPVCVAVTDSYGYGIDITANTPQWIWDAYPVRAGRYFGWDVHPATIGGTGFVSTYGGTQPTYLTRLNTDVINLNPDIVIVCGTQNDGENNISSAATSLFNSLASALPNARLIGFSGVASIWPLYVGIQMSGASIQSAVTAVGGDYISGLDWCGGNGSFYSPNGTGNADHYSDGQYHMTQAGYTYVAERLASSLSSLLTRKAFR